MKKVLFFIATAVLLFASCTQEKLENPATDEVTVSFSAEVPGAALTRAYGAAESVNILTYFVYDSGQTTLICKDTAPVNGGVAHVHLTLVKGKSYDILFWAQSSEADAYTVSEDQTLKVDYGKLSSNDDANDAFYAFRTFDITGPINESVHLLRPFAQINLGTNDPDNADKNYFPAASRMTATLPDVLNLKSNETSGEVVVRTYAKSEIEEGEFPISDYKYLAMNYVLVGNAPTITDLVFNLYKNLDDENPNNTIIVSNAPIQQNYRTNIYGALLSDDADFEIEVDSDFGGTEDNMNLSEVSTELELANALANGGEIKLLADITTEKAYQLNKTTTLNLNGSTLTYNGDDIFFRVNGAVTRASEGTSLTVKGAGAINSGDYIFLVNEGGKLYLDADATYVGETTIVNVNGGEAYISAGDFSVSNPVGGTNEAKYLLDHVDDQKGNGLIEVTGGTFHGFNPEESYSEDPAMNFLAEGYSTKVCGIDQAGYTVYEVISVQDLSSGGTANSYIVSESGTYRFPATHKGNEAEPSIDKASIASAEVLWESFGTSAAPTAKDLISEVSYNANDGLVTFSATDKKGNALIAVKDSEGTILWSWHIWMTDAPQDQVYRNNAGIMMDRNLGATSATPGDGMLTHGLVYQWGRKDPFIMRNYNGDDNTDLMKSVGAE